MRLAATGKTPLSVHVFFALLFVVFTCVFPYITSMNNPNENVRTFMTMALVENHTLQVDAQVEKYGSNADLAMVNDKVTKIPHVFSLKGPGTSYSGVPFYWAFTKIAPHFGHPVPSTTSKVEDRIWWLRSSTFVVRLFAVQIPCFLFLVWFERFLRGTTSDLVLRLTAVAAAGVGTNYLGYAMMFASHSTFAIAAFMSFGITYRARTSNFGADRGPRSAFLAAFFATLATVFEYHAFPVTLILFLYGLVTFRQPRKLIYYVLGAAVNTALMMYFQWRAFGSPFTPGHKFAQNARFHAELNRGLFGIEKPSFQVFKDLSLSHSFGFFGLSPYMWLGLLAIPLAIFIGYGTAGARRERRIGTFIWMSAMLALWVAISAANNWRGGWTVGPRYLGAAPPFFAWGAVCALEAFAGVSALRRSFARGVAAGLSLASALSIGVVELQMNSLQEGVTRPLSQVTIPLAKAGFAPYNAGDFVGMKTPTFWYFVCACLIAAVVLAALVRDAESIRGYLVRIPTFAGALALGLMPAFSPPNVAAGEPPLEAGIGGCGYLADNWEPPGRDKISLLRAKMADPARADSCDIRKLSDLEKSVGLTRQAAQDDRRAKETAKDCK